MREIIHRIITHHNSKNGTLKAKGIYKGWVLINDSLAEDILEDDYSTIQFELSSRNYQLVRWSSLSGDEDDYNDFAIRFGVKSI